MIQQYSFFSGDWTITLQTWDHFDPAIDQIDAIEMFPDVAMGAE